MVQATASASHRCGQRHGDQWTARARWPDQQTIEQAFDLGQPCETDCANPCSSSADSRVQCRDRCGSPAGTPECDATAVCNQAERSRAIGAHFPEVADIAAAAALAARLAVRFKPVIRPTSNPARRGTARALVRFPAGGIIVPMLGSRSKTQVFGSTDEVSRPRLGFDANINRDITLR